MEVPEGLPVDAEIWKEQKNKVCGSGCQCVGTSADGIPDGVLYEKNLMSLGTDGFWEEQ